MSRNPLPKKGFTLIELLVVVAVIGLIAALLLPALVGAKRKAQQTTCINHLRQINLGVRMYSDESQDATPSPGGAGLNATNIDTLYIGYKALIKNYVGANGSAGQNEKLFQCPADQFYPTWFNTNSAWPYRFAQTSACSEPMFDFSSYLFNGGDNVSRNYGKLTPAYPGLSGIKLTAVKHPTRTVLVGEVAAFAPFSWHDPSSHGTANVDGTLYNDSKNVLSFVDGHVSYLKMFWKPGEGLACWYNPPAGYDYQWSPD